MSAFLMAVYFSNMSDREVSRLTECMLRSGDTVDLSGHSRRESGQAFHRRRGR
jgi:thymidine phosphorylase